MVTGCSRVPFLCERYLRQLANCGNVSGKCKMGVLAYGRYPMEHKQEAFINFQADINGPAVGRLTNAVQTGLAQGVERFVLLISSPGGQVNAGIAGYNLLRGIPAEVITHNYGVIDSMAVVLFSAGQERYCVPHARFLLHGVGFNVTQPTRFEEKHLDERRKGLMIDRQNIARIVAERCGRNVADVEADMLEVKTLTATEAVEYGLVHSIKTELIPKGVQVTFIGPQ